MAEPRALQHMRDRRSIALRDEISAILEGELGDPRIGLATVTEVQMGAGGKSATVFINVEGTEDEAEKTIQGLNAAVGFIRHQLVLRLQLRRPPELHFHHDRGHSYGARVDQLLQRVAKRRKKVI